MHNLQEAGFTLRWVKCKLGMTRVEWFSHRFLGVSMRVAEDQARIIQQWPKPTTIKEVNSFLATIQFNTVYLAAKEGEKTYAQLEDPFR